MGEIVSLGLFINLSKGHIEKSYRRKYPVVEILIAGLIRFQAPKSLMCPVSCSHGSANFPSLSTKETDI